jgi:hypothetical protein
MSNDRPSSRAFTIVELMVTVGIIALLIGILLPGLGMVRATANATKSQSNLRQWGIGTIAWAGINEERLPWEGLKEASSMSINLAVPQYWANAVPPMVGQRPYKDISSEAFTAQKNVDQFTESDFRWGAPTVLLQLRAQQPAQQHDAARREPAGLLA